MFEKKIIVHDNASLSLNKLHIFFQHQWHSNMVDRKCKIAMAWKYGQVTSYTLSYTEIGIATLSAMAYAQ